MNKYEKWRIFIENTLNEFVSNANKNRRQFYRQNCTCIFNCEMQIKHSVLVSLPSQFFCSCRKLTTFCHQNRCNFNLFLLLNDFRVDFVSVLLSVVLKCELYSSPTKDKTVKMFGECFNVWDKMKFRYIISLFAKSLFW